MCMWEMRKKKKKIFIFQVSIAAIPLYVSQLSETKEVWLNYWN